MSRTQYIALAVIVVFAGFAGGLVSSALFSPDRAGAEKILSSNIIEAEGFHLVDKTGAVRGTFALGDDGQPRINFLDNNGIPRLILNDDAMQTRAGVMIDSDGVPGLYLFDGAGRERLRLSLGASGDPFLIFRHRECNHPVGLSLDENGYPRLDLFERTTNAGITLELQSQGTPAMRIIDTEGIIRKSIAIDTSRNISMEFFDEKSRPRATIGSTMVKNERSGENEILPPPRHSCSMTETEMSSFRLQRSHGG